MNIATRSLLGAFLLLAACGCSAPDPLPFFGDASLTPVWMSATQAQRRHVHQVAPFRFRDHNGRPMTRDSLTGRVTLVHFFFAHCADICPTTTRNVATTLRNIGADERAQVLSYSIMPERDSVFALKAFAELHQLTDPRWHLLAGDRAQLASLAASSFFVEIGDGSTYGVASIAHTETVLLVDSQGRVRGVYAASLPLEMQRAAEDARTLLEHLDD